MSTIAIGTPSASPLLNAVTCIAVGSRPMSDSIRDATRAFVVVPFV